MSIEKIIENYITPKEKLNINQLLKMIREEMSDLQGNILIEQGEKAVSSQEKAQQFLLALPKFVPSSAWGKPNSEARKQINLFIRQLPGPATLESKIQYLRNLQEPKGTITSTRRIISTLILMESLASVVTAFGDSAAGFVFEGFLAALLGGYQVDEPAGAGLPIEDIVAFKYKEGDPGVPMSLKLLKPKSKIKGSYSNLMVALQNYPEGMKYVLAVKGGESGLDIEIKEFDITRNNILEMLLAGASSNENLLSLSGEARKMFNLSSTESSVNLLRSILQNNGWDDFFKVIQVTDGFNVNIKNQLAQLKAKESEEQRQPPEEEQTQLQEWVHYIPESFQKDLLIEGATDTQWYLSQPQLKNPEAVAALSLNTIGVLDVNPESLLSTAEKYIELINDQVTLLFQSVKDLSENLNQFFVDKNRQRGLGKGSEAIENARIINETTSEELKKAQEEPEPGEEV